MERKKVVVDASVVAKWYVKEEWSDKALELRSDYERGILDLIAPELIIYEVANALRFSPELGSEDVYNSVASLIDMQLDLKPLTRELSKCAVEDAYRYNLTFYDSVYLSLAKSFKVKLVSGDEKMIRRVRSKDLIPLSEYCYIKV